MSSQLLLLPIALVLLLGSATKAVAPRHTRRVLQQLGVPSGVARPAVWVLVLVEYATAVLLMLRPTPAVLVLVLVLFGVFGGVGVYQLARGADVTCGCLGSVHSARIGWHQIVQFVIVLALVAPALTGSSQPSESGLAYLTGAQLAAVLVLLASAARPALTVRRQRRSMAIA